MSFDIKNVNSTHRAQIINR